MHRIIYHYLNRAMAKKKYDKKTFLQIMLLDALFCILLGLAAYKLLLTIAPHATAVSQMVAEQMQAAGQVGQLLTREEVYQSLMGNEQFLAYYSEILDGVLLLALAFIILYCLLQSVTWWLALGKPLPFMKYLYRFSLVSLAWFLALIAVLLVYANAAQGIDSLFIPGAFRALYFLLLIAAVLFISYFLVLCYYFLKEKSWGVMLKKTFATGFKRFKSLFWKFLLIGAGKLGLLIFVVILVSVLGINLLVGAILFLVLVIPYVAWAKLKLVRIIENV
ncbi:hypothetical protein HYV81_01255 [Candidatus Woesearchaeota archaeon]|nr:hypothetical protein [Candidatus Woesearchaeota archaeon]